jgi:carbamoyltransferase
MSVYILGLNAYHGDSSACLLKDGVLIAACEEERFRRIKHWAGFPSEAIKFCLQHAGITLADLAHVAINSDPKANAWAKLAFALRSRPPWQLLMDRLRNQSKRLGLQAEFDSIDSAHRFTGQVHRIEHHLAHLASAFDCSPFERATVISVDGFGDFASGAFGFADEHGIHVRGRVLYPHSLGAFYQAMTQYLGFPNYGDEYKVMGLAPYGEAKYLDAMRKLVHLQDDGSYRLNLEMFRFHREKVEYDWDGGSPRVGTLFGPGLERLLGPARDSKAELTQYHKDLARSTQAMYEEAFFHLLNTQQRLDGCEAITIAGGCGMNSVANGKIRRMTPYKRVYVQSAAGDAGGAIGAAAVVARKLKLQRPRMAHAYLGPSFDDAQIAAVLEREAQALRDQQCQIKRHDDLADLAKATAHHVAEGKVVGWFQGGSEWGPRALGNRSIVCDPRRGDMKDILNLKIKRRESFRPFAPSVLREATAAWFEEVDDVPFMMQVFQIRAEQRVHIPAVTHVDGSGRLQTVEQQHNPRYHALISAFAERTGVPMVLNTSFNENEPVVNKPEEALACFLRTKMDVLVLGNHLIERTA